MLTASGTDKCSVFVKSLSKKAQANLDRTLDHLQVQPKIEWDRPHASPVGHNIYVIRFKDENRSQWRLFGHFHDPHTSFVVSLHGSERDGVYEPADYVDQCSDNRTVCDQRFDARTRPGLGRECLACAQRADTEHRPRLPSAGKSS